MPQPTKVVITKMNNLGESLAAEVQIDSRWSAAEIKAAMRSVLDAFDDRFREMNLRLLAASLKIKDLPPEAQKAVHEAVAMIAGAMPVPEDIQTRVESARQEQGSEAFGGDRDGASPADAAVAV